MKEESKNYYQEEKAKKEFLIFDRGLSELTVPKTEEKKSKNKINWFFLYKILFKNILNSKEIIPIEELNLRFNIIRTSLPKYYKGYKGNDSNSSAIIKKFTYHICKSKKRSRSYYKLGLNIEEKAKLFNSEKKVFNDKSLSQGKSKSVKINNNLENNIKSSPNKKKIVSIDSIKFKDNNNIYNTENSKDDNFITNNIILGTPSDAEYPLVLSQKRNFNAKPTFFYESLSKIKELTKQEKIKTFQKEFTSQILKFNDLYFDPKIDDFSNDKLFNDVKATCDLFINKFHIDSDEEKNLADLDNYI
jgi:hypothetical protein